MQARAALMKCRHRCNAFYRDTVRQSQHSHDADSTRCPHHGRRRPGFAALCLGGVREHHFVHAAPAALLLGHVVRESKSPFDQKLIRPAVIMQPKFLASRPLDACMAQSSAFRGS